MAPPYPPQFPVTYTRRRNRKAMLEQMREQHERFETSQLEDQFKTEQMLETIEKLEMPQEFKDLVRMQTTMLNSMFSGGGPFMRPVPTVEEFRQQELEQIADRFAGMFTEKTETGFTTWNFAELLAGEGITRLEYFDVDTQRPAGVFLYRDDDLAATIEGAAATALVRYLHFVGIFELQKAKKPCPECGDKPPQDCDVCGGLGWVL